MLRITVIASAARAEAYYVSSAEYYHGEEILPSRWQGKGADLLGLHGEVTKEQFSALVRNRNPFTGERVTAADRQNRRVGFDLTFSIDKSLSIQALVGQDERILHVFRESVEETMQLVEQDAAVRVRAGGKDEDQRVGNLVYATFYHGLTRPTGEENLPEPHCHAHVVCLNMAFDHEEIKWKALQPGDIKASGQFYQSVFRAKLAQKVQSLGYEIEVSSGDFRLKGYGQELIDRFSNRTKEVETLAQNLAKEKKVPRLTAAVKARLGATSRQNKRMDLSWEELRQRWQARLTPEEAGFMYSIHEQARAMRKGIPMEDRSVQAFDLALDHLLERKSVVTERELLTETLRRGLGNVSIENATSQLDRPEILKAQYDGHPCVSTREVIAEEKELIEIVRRGMGRAQPLSPPREELLSHLNEGQRQAVRHLMGATGNGRFALISGRAGTGKSQLLKAAVVAIEEQGVHVTVLAPTASASRINLRADDIESAETLQRFLVDERMQQRAAGQQLILDEASLAGIKDMLALARIADEKNIRVGLLGDAAQHKAVSRGHVLAILEEFAGVKPVRVSEILRQSGEYKKTVNLLAEGRITEAFDRLQNEGAILAAGHDELARQYVQYLRENRDVLVVSPTHAEGNEVATAIRVELKQNQIIGAEDRYFTRLVDLQTTESDRRDANNCHLGHVAQFTRNRGPYKAGQRVVVTSSNQQELREYASAYRLFRQDILPLAVNDQIRVTVGGRSLCGRKLDAGRRFTVKGFTRQGDIVTHNNLRLSKDFQHLVQDYVTTSFQAQSRTVDAVLVAQSSQSLGASNASQAYVTLSRARLTGTRKSLPTTSSASGRRSRGRT